MVSHLLTWQLALAMAMLSVASTLGEDKTSSAGEMTVQVLGQSGKFKVYKTALGGADDKQVVVEMDALREVDSAGNEVGTSGSTKHSINSFASQSFTFAPVEAVALGNATANKVSFTSQISTVGEIRVDTYIVSKDGYAGPQGEEWPVSPGDVKFNIAMPSWTWCNPCKQGNTNEVGAFIDLDVVIKGKADSAEKGISQSYDLGGDAKLELTDKVMVDGSQTTMPEGYPKLSVVGGKQVFTFRFPKFTTSIEYDPLLDMDAGTFVISGALGLSSRSFGMVAVLLSTLFFM